MQEFNVIIITENENFTERVACGTRFLSLAQKYANYYKDQIVLVAVNKKLCELNKEVEGDCELEFVTMTQNDGRRFSGSVHHNYNVDSFHNNDKDYCSSANSNRHIKSQRI